MPPVDSGPIQAFCLSGLKQVENSLRNAVVFGHLLQRGFRRRRWAPARDLGGDFVSSASLSIMNSRFLPLWGGPPLPVRRSSDLQSSKNAAGGRRPLRAGQRPALAGDGRAFDHLADDGTHAACTVRGESDLTGAPHLPGVESSADDQEHRPVVLDIERPRRLDAKGLHQRQTRPLAEQTFDALERLRRRAVAARFLETSSALLCGALLYRGFRPSADVHGLSAPVLDERVAELGLGRRLPSPEQGWWDERFG